MLAKGEREAGRSKTVVGNCACVSHSIVSDSCDPMDCSPPGSSVHRILQARILEWVATPFSRGSSQCRDQTQSHALQADSLPSEPSGKPLIQRPDGNKYFRLCGSYSLSELLHSAAVGRKSHGQYTSELE